VTLQRGEWTLRLLAALAAGLLLAAACSSGDDGGEATAQAADDGGGAADDQAAADDDAGTADDEADDQDTGDAFVYPGAEWERADPEEMGFDPAALDAIAADAERSGSTCLVVTRRGRIAAEWYWQGGSAESPREVFSVTKSHASTLVGIAQADGALDVDDPASEYIESWAGTPSEDVTIENLLSNDSGREWSLAIDYGQLIRQPDMDAFATGLGQQAPPGTEWAYNNSAIQTLDAVLRAATGGSSADLAAERLYEPLGMDHTEMTPDGVGNTRMFMGVQSTCEDLARFGYLFLRHGEWDGEEIVPEDWVESAVGHPSQDINDAYGYLWWLNRPGAVLGAIQATGAGQEPPDDAPSQLVPGAPEDMFFAVGLGNQIVAVDPGSETVVVRLGGGTAAEGAPEFGTARAAAVVTDALVDPDA
jgi:CubicO group peptidase (beta-lactamase class C family)